MLDIMLQIYDVSDRHPKSFDVNIDSKHHTNDEIISLAVFTLDANILMCTRHRGFTININKLININ